MAQKIRKDPFVVAARSFRPQRFDDVIGQEHVTRVLQNAIESDRVAHAYLFCGPRGVGKTTTARILSKALNCGAREKPTPDPCQECPACLSITSGTSVDVIEIDGASNRGIDEVRELRANARLQPAMGRYRIYYIDEVHMLTREAFNALLKILEEPPPHLRFIMSTTEEHKVPETIVSRCQTYRFRLMNTESIVDHLRRVVAAQRKTSVADEVFYHVARAAAGSMRDGLSLLEQVLALSEGEITFEDAELVLGTVDYGTLVELSGHLHDGKVTEVLRIADTVARSGKDLGQFVRDLVDHYRNLLVVNSLEKPEESLMLSPEELEKVREQAKDVSEADILRAVEILWEAETRMRYLSDPRIVLEVALVKIARLGRTVDIQRLLDRLDAFEGNISGGGASLSASPAPAAEPEGGEEKTLFRKRESEPVTAGGPAAPVPPASPPPGGPVKTGAPASAAPPPADGNGFLEGARSGWGRIVREIQAKSPRVAGCLRGARPVAYDRGTLVIGVPHTHRYQHTALGKPDENRLLASVVKEVLGTGVKVRCELYEFQDVDEDEPPPEPEEIPEKEEEPPNEDTLREEHPMLGTLLERFQGRIVAVRPPDRARNNDAKEEA